MRVRVGIEPANQAAIVGLDVPVFPLGLRLRTDWTDARPIDRRWVVSGLAAGEEVTAAIAGRDVTATADVGGTAAIVWDGRDAGGNPVGPAVATATVAGTLRRMRLGRWDARAVGLGGLTMPTHDHLDAVVGRLHLGTGRQRRRVAVTANGDGWHASQASGRRIATFGPDGFLREVTDVATGRALLRFERDEVLRSMTTTAQTLEVTDMPDGRRLGLGHAALDVQFGDDGRARRVVSPQGSAVDLRWTDGLLTEVREAAGLAHAFEYDEDGRLVGLRRPGRGPVRFVRTATDHGWRVLVLTAEGRESSYQVERLPDGTRVRTTRCCGRPPRVVRTSGDVVEVEVGDGTRIRTVRATGERTLVLPSGAELRSRRTADGVTIDGRTWRWTRGPSGVVSVSPEGRVRGAEADEGATTLRNGDGAVTVAHADADGVARVTQAGQSWRIEHDDAGLVTAAVRDDGHRVDLDRDRDGWLVAQHTGEDRRVLIERGGGGTVVGLQAPGGGVARMTHAAEDLLVRMAFGPDEPESDVDALTLGRDDDGDVTSIRWGTGPEVVLERDATGQVTAMGAAGETISTREHEHGRPVVVTTAAGQRTSLRWDGALLTGLVQEGPITTGAVHRRHGAGLLVDAVASGALHAAVRRDADGLITGLGPVAVDRDDRGRVVALRGGVVEQRWEHDAHGRVARMHVLVRGNVGWQVEYERDDRGRIARMTDSRMGDGSTATFTYDDAGRLTVVDGPGACATSWDAAGNAVEARDGDATRRMTFDASDRLREVDGEPVVLDEAARLREDASSGLVAEYDALGRLVRVARDGATTSVDRDGFGQVIRTASDGGEQHLVPGPHGHPEVVVDAAGTPLLLLVGGTDTSPPTVAVAEGRSLLLAQDHLGTVRLVIDVESGDLLDEREHDHWGNLVRRSGSSLVPFGWGGGLLDEATGLVHFPERTYSPQLRRFLTRDPLLYRGGSTNLFAFADGDPVNFGDPTGTTRVCRQAWKRWAVPGTDISETWEHWWLEDADGNEAGWGPERDSTWNKTGMGEFGEVRDHGNRSEGAECDEVEDVDDECVAREMQKRMGDKLGFWGPGNSCQNWVDDVLSACSDGDYTVVTDNPDAYDNSYSPDVNTRPPDSGTDSGGEQDAGSGGQSSADGDGGYTPADGEYTPADGGSLWD